MIDLSTLLEHLTPPEVITMDLVRNVSVSSEPCVTRGAITMTARKKIAGREVIIIMNPHDSQKGTGDA